MKFIHTADLHLDSPFEGLKEAPAAMWEQIYHSTFSAFERLVDEALTEKVDFVVIVGDLYDQEEQSLMVQAFLVAQFERLNEQHIRVFLSHGNHDYRSEYQFTLAYPENVFVFGEKVEEAHLEVDGQKVVISGFSYTKRWLDEDQTSQFKIKGDEDWHIGLLHGSIANQTSEHAHYAPFTLSELKSKNYDYWALGHIHKRQVLSENPPIIYPGNSQGRHKNEAGDKGYYLVESHGKSLVAQFKAVAPIVWEQWTISLLEYDTLEKLKHYLTQKMALIQNNKKSFLVSLDLTSSEQVEASFKQRLENGEVLAYLQQLLGQANQSLHFCWFYQLTLDYSKYRANFSKLDTKYWQAAEEEVFQSELTYDLLESDKLHPILREMMTENVFSSDLKKQALEQLESFNQEVD